MFTFKINVDMNPMFAALSWYELIVIWVLDKRPFLPPTPLHRHFFVRKRLELIQVFLILIDILLNLLSYPKHIILHGYFQSPIAPCFFDIPFHLNIKFIVKLKGRLH